ncbi:hypothetical protein EG346_09775 [Chryseobacterium carnipullorum]|uniref:Predicted integral membrane metal-binding protein n=2 Tax=Chryseobacterium carnipullorum TaxID=1124835 RepID=A0A376DNB0_CHRCU|nr:hypothetical protein [Chryseobacterium carnipullorum]AZA48451.1 hypothetical protein EG346_09775 [Chryseobacterium carnipullorum]STC92357.1 Predicted integral membrane metal-binding protein [Chryseobacterium carnipullorum]
MATNIDFKNLWKQQTTEKPSIEELLGRLKKFKNENIRKLAVTNILLIVTSVGIGLIWYHYQPQLMTSKIGIILIILAMVIFLSAYNQLFTNFYKLNNTQTNTEYLNSLYSLKSKQKFIQTTMMNIYFMMLFIGICLYMYEYTSRMTVFYGITVYAVTFLWIAFNWFYLRPKTIKKQQAKLNGLIDKFEEINNQLKQ